MTNPAANPIEHLVSDLASSEKNLRLAAVFQLGNSLAEERVRQALEDSQSRESDPEVLFYIQQTLSRVTASPPEPVGEQADSLPDWRKLSADRYQELLGPLSVLGETQRVEVVEQILSAFPAPALIHALFELGPGFPIAHLSEVNLRFLLFHPDPVIGVRALYQTSRSAPERGLPFLSDLLRKPSLLTRALSLRLLHRFVPEQALRLLEEFLDHPDPARRGIGIGLLFQFPFEEVAGALLNLIESNGVPPNSEELVLALIRSNPNPGFALRVTMLERNKTDDSKLRAMADAAAEALILGGIEKGTVLTLRHQLQERADKQIEKILQLPAREEEVQSPKQLEDPPRLKPSTASLVKGPGKGTIDDRIAFQSELESVKNSVQLLKLLLPLAERRERRPEFGLPAFAALHQFPSADSNLIVWSESLLEHAPEPLLLAAMRYLEREASRRLVSHLPFLAFHSSPFVASQAVRILRGLEGAAFFRRLDAWILDPDPRARKAAMAGLLQIDFNRARILVLKHLNSATDREVLEGLRSMVCMNPDRRLIAEIRSMAAKASNDKRREFLNDLADSCQSELSELYGPGSASSALSSLREVWADQVEKRLNDLLEQLSLVHFSSRQPWFEDRDRIFRISALIVGFLAILFFFRASDTEKLPPGSGSSASTTPARPSRSSNNQRYMEPTTVIGKLESYEPLTHFWKFRTSDGGLHKLRFSSGKLGQEAGKSISAEIVFLGTSPLGYNLYLVRKFQILTQ